MKRSEIRDVLAKRDRVATKMGQAAAEKYLRSKQPLPTQGRIREFLAALVAGTIIVIGVIFLAIGLAP
ncbi:MAG TPA: hypothetical protein VKP88_02835 [Candidatus Paceibacterota bacterium]|nr:hypothetical protein [Candidatus Paceibacterota bacterium]